MAKTYCRSMHETCVEFERPTKQYKAMEQLRRLEIPYTKLSLLFVEKKYPI